MRTLLRLKRLLSVAFLLFVCSSLSWAGEYITYNGIRYNTIWEGKDFYSNTHNYKAYVASSSYSGDVTIPSKFTITDNSTNRISNYQVVGIEDEAFYGKKITSITLPKLETIGARAFKQCNMLSSINISAESIGKEAFYLCEQLRSINITAGSVEESAFQSCYSLQSVEAIVGRLGSSVFKNCSALESVKLQADTIGEKAFYDCSSLNNLMFYSNDKAQYIGSYAFSGCSKLSSVNITKYKVIGSYAFQNCTKLSSCYLSSSLESIEDRTFKGCSSLSHISLPNELKSIGVGAFSGCSKLNNLVIPQSVKYIKQLAFEKCSSLITIILPESIETIGGGAFRECTNLNSVTLPESLTDIYSETFSGCTKLTNIQIPNSVKSIGEKAFANCLGNKEIIIPESVTSIGSKAFSGWAELSKVTILSEDALNGNNTIKVKDIFGEQITEYIIGDNVTKIGINAFGNCTNLTSVTIGTGMKEIGTHSFAGCTSLPNISIPRNVNQIGDGAFSGCSSLTSVTCRAESVPGMGYSVFYEVPLASAELFVPNSSIEAYKEHQQWGQFSEIKAVKMSLAQSITLNKTETSIKISQSEQLIATVFPFDASGKVTWTSSNPEIASVDNDGVVSALNIGTTTITATSTDGTNISATCKITVYRDPIFISRNLTHYFPVDWQGWFGATGYTDTKYAPLITTSDGRQVQVCERYNNYCVDEGDIMYRVFEELPNGTYTVKLYCGAAYTPNRGIYTELEETSYDAVYLYANSKIASFPAIICDNFTNSELTYASLYSVPVTDGTLEICMCSKKANTTNWHVIQIVNVTASVNAEEYHASILSKAQQMLSDENYSSIIGSERTLLLQAVSDNSIVESYTQDAYSKAVDALETAIKTFTEAKGSYDAWAQMRKYRFPYATKEKIAAIESVDLPTSAEDATRKAEALVQPYRECAESSAMLEGLDGATDMTSYIKNPNAEESIDATVWQTILGNGSNGALSIRADQPWTDSKGGTEHKYFDGGNWGASAWDVALQQNITLPTGRYQLTALGRSAADVALTLFANNETAEMAHIGSTGGLFNNGWEQTSVEFELTKEQTVTIGVRGITSVLHNWMSFSNFRLMKFPAEAEITITADNQTMTYGDDLPELTYKVTGGELNGRPKLSTTATKTSPVGTYPITVEKGTVTNGNVKFANGTLTITKAPLTVGVQNESIQEGDDIPAFTLTYDGFRNGDTEATAFTTRPVASTTATKASPVGTYPITVSGGAAGNYALTYTSGTLTITEKPDVTPLITKYIDNPTFEGATITEGVTTYAKDIQDGQVSGMQPVSGWEFGVENGDAKASGLYEIGGSAFLGGIGYLAPTAGPNGEAEGNLLGMVAVWGATVQYINKTVTLPAGTYTLTVPIYNSKGGTNVPTKSLIGFIADNGTEYLAPAKTYAVDKWTIERVTFTIGEETTGHFSLGYTMTGVGSANAPHFFISSPGLEATTELDAALKVLREEIAAAEALKTEARTEGLAVFNNAINAAKAMLVSKDVAAIEAAVETLKAAEEAFLTANLPVAEGTYYVYNPQTKKFLSRGASWGTRAVVDDYGVAIRLDVADLPNAAYTLTGFDNNLSYGEDGGMYCDKSGGKVCKYIITNVKGSFTMTETNNGHQVYINEENLTVNHNDAGGTGTYNIWQFLTKEQRDQIVADREAAAKAAAFEKAGINIDDELVVAQPTEVSFTTGNNWTETVVRTDKRPVCNEYGTEMWQTVGNYTQTIENVKSGLYTVTIQAFYRNGVGIQDVERVSTGYNTVLACLEANGNKVQVKSWASDKDEENEPSTMETSKAKFDEGKYLSAVYTFVDGDGLLSLKVDNPAYISNGWLMIGNVKYALVEKSADSGINDISTDVSSARFYDLQGRRVNPSSLRKGLYIVDGKKVVRK